MMWFVLSFFVFATPASGKVFDFSWWAVGSVSGFALNPAGLSDMGSFGIMAGRSRAKLNFTRRFSGGGRDVVISQSRDDVVLVSLFNQFGGGIQGRGLFYLRDSQDISNKEGRDDDVTEKFSKLGSLLSLSLGVSERISAGFLVNVSWHEDEIYGRFFLRKHEKTAFSSLFLGIGGGLRLEIDQLAFAVLGILPMKSKAAILGEQKILIEPGVLQGQGSVEFAALSLQAFYSQFLYKKDDRGLGSTLNNENRSRINLFGLNPARNNLFLLSELQLGMVYPYSDRFILDFSLIREQHELNFDPSRQVPGQEKSDKLADFYLTKLGFLAKRSNLSFMAGALISVLEKFEHKSGVDVSVEGSELVFYLGLTASL